jgi:diguanylate cyclase (GGDEF)-like protein/PAS domain S-box-containing protein
LRESEHQFRDLYENATDIIFTLDLAGRFTSINKAAETATGYTAREALRLTIKDVLSPEEAELVEQSIQNQLGGQPPQVIEVNVRSKHGHKVPVEVKGRLLFKEGRPVGIQGIGRDITSRKQVEQVMQDRREVLQMIAENQPLGNVLLRLVRMVERYSAGGVAAVLRVRDGRIEILTAPGLPQACLRAWNHPADSGAACRKQAVVSPDLAEDPSRGERAAVALAHGFRAYAAAPVLSGDNTIGMVEVYHRSARDPSPFERDVLGTAADLAAIAFEHQVWQDRLAHQAHHDPLTGLPNRLLFEDRLQQAIAAARRHRRSMAVLFVDLDRFKLVNDTLGHSTGDLLLRQVAQRFSSCLRDSDTLARTGGDEFTLVLSDIGHPEGVCSAAEKLVTALKRPVQAGHNELFVSASIGIALYPEDGDDADTLKRKADTAMYFAKKKGGGTFQKYTPEIRVISEKRLALENDLHAALERKELSLHYQPQFDLATGRLAGLEALLRWFHPELGLVLPGRFISIAEESGLIARLSHWVLEEACAQNSRWQLDGYVPVRIAVNIPASQFSREDLAGLVARILCRHRLDSSLLELELTESAVMEDVAASISQMKRLRALGVGISIDDFGTGYSSLSYMQALPVDNLKIDRTFLHSAGNHGGTGPMVQAIVNLAHGLGLTVTAEGVESELQLRSLRRIGCDRAQGFCLGRPMPAALVPELLAESRPPAVAPPIVGIDSAYLHVRPAGWREPAEVPWLANVRLPLTPVHGREEAELSFAEAAGGPRSAVNGLVVNRPPTPRRAAPPAV